MKLVIKYNHTEEHTVHKALGSGGFVGSEERQEIGKISVDLDSEDVNGGYLGSTLRCLVKNRISFSVEF